MHLPCRTVLHCCSSLGKGKGDSEEEHTEAAVARLPWILPSARAGMATDQPAQEGMLVEESRLSPLRPRSQFVFLAACGTRPSCSRWRAASTRTLELLRCLAASKRPAAPCMVMGRMSAVGGVQRSEAYILGAALEVLCSRGRRKYVCSRSYRQGGRRCATRARAVPYLTYARLRLACVHEDVRTKVVLLL